MSNNGRAVVRSEMRKVLSSLDPRWMQVASREVCSNLSRVIDMELPRDIKHVLAWVNFSSGEVDLSAFISEQVGFRSIYIPRIINEREMAFLAIGPNWENIMPSNQQGIIEVDSLDSEEYDSKDAYETAVIIPGLAFDRAGNRLDRGRGYYDRLFQSDNMSNALRIGVCWSFQILPSLAHDSETIPMQWICHEEGCLGVSKEEGENKSL